MSLIKITSPYVSTNTGKSVYLLISKLITDTITGCLSNNTNKIITDLHKFSNLMLKLIKPGTWTISLFQFFT